MLLADIESDQPSLHLLHLIISLDCRQMAGSSAHRQPLHVIWFNAGWVQGTNAHAILTRSSSQPEAGATADTVWRRERFWFTVCAHALLLQASPAPQQATLTFQTPLTGPQLAFLHDHRILDRGLFPGAAMFEMAGAAMRAMQLQQQLPEVQARAPVLDSVSIAQPLVMKLNEMQMLLCTANLVDGKISISSTSHGPRAMHMTAMAGEPWFFCPLVDPQPISSCCSWLHFNIRRGGSDFNPLG